MTATATTPTALWLPAPADVDDETAWSHVANQIAEVDDDIEPELVHLDGDFTYEDAEAAALEWGESDDAGTRWVVLPVRRPREIVGTKNRTFTINLDNEEPLEDLLGLAAAELGDLGPDARITEVEVLDDKIRHKTDSGATTGKAQTVYWINRVIEEPAAEGDSEPTLRFEPVLDADGNPCCDVAQAKARTLAVDLSSGPEIGNRLVITATVQRDTGSPVLVEVQTAFASRKVKLKATIAKLGPGTDGIVGWMVGLAHQ